MAAAAAPAPTVAAAAPGDSRETASSMDGAAAAPHNSAKPATARPPSRGRLDGRRAEPRKGALPPPRCGAGAGPGARTVSALRSAPPPGNPGAPPPPTRSAPPAAPGSTEEKGGAELSGSDPVRETTGARVSAKVERAETEPSSKWKARSSHKPTPNPSEPQNLPPVKIC